MWRLGNKCVRMFLSWTFLETALCAIPKEKERGKEEERICSLRNVICLTQNISNSNQQRDQPEHNKHGSGGNKNCWPTCSNFCIAGALLSRVLAEVEHHHCSTMLIGGGCCGVAAGAAQEESLAIAPSTCGGSAPFISHHIIPSWLLFSHLQEDKWQMETELF